MAVGTAAREIRLELTNQKTQVFFSMNPLTQRGSHRIEEHAQSLRELGHQHLARDELGLAEAAFRQALEIEPDWQCVKVDLGCLLQRQSNYAEAEPILRQALYRDPEAEFAHNALGLLCWDTNRLNEAETHYRKAIRVRPDFYEAQNNLGLLLMHTNRLQEAEIAFRHALAIDATTHEIQSNYGSVLRQLGRVEEAIAAFRQALSLNPHSVAAKTNLAQALLASGVYEEGWSMYESRLDPTLNGHYGEAPLLPWPMWSGEPLVGKSLIIWPEQGYGDVLQFCRYAPMLKALGLETLSIACQPSLERLFHSLDGVDCVYSLNGEGTIARHDYWCFVMSLPHRFGTTLDTIPASTPYLRAPRDLILRWRNWLPPGQLRVGLVWAGDPRLHTPASNAMDQRRSVSAETFLPILSVPGITFVSLQKGAIAEKQIDNLPAELRPFDPMSVVEHFGDTAAIIESLDLVIAVDTSVAHLAGALNRPVWVLSRYGSCWRWLGARPDSPWYPSMRLFRQREPGDWEPVIEEVRQALIEWCASRPALV
ncbi:tetratricopeptide repeat-containing glycosyltransferase family protein [Paraburkholderia caledonica]|uniref:Tetratricopeptide (TPR) repeat protein n=1 Tax=Paraburkholderia caledonica TaxID=134536 RepID=A0ABU1L6G2_9BURK|nr:tetratricopeptide repeat-containing glycosyltransferase family protein [Paraburkholderia caledonica]MDR6378800.1 tetratricopeptide (TPR) repeat protein [Paraburkholderia caledonica]